MGSRGQHALSWQAGHHGATEMHGHFPTGQVQPDRAHGAAADKSAPPTRVTQAGQPLGIVPALTGPPGGGCVGRDGDEESRGWGRGGREEMGRGPGPGGWVLSQCLIMDAESPQA